MRTPKNRGRASSRKNIKKSNKMVKSRKRRRCSNRPYETHYLQVSHIHKICYYEFGNPNGEPVFVIHGGPGDCSRFENAKLFDCSKYRIIFMDQRGCGKSKPFCEIKDNTTFELVEDIERVRIACGLGHRKVQMFGVSWGTFLTLSYAIKYPNNVSRIVLRSVFLCTKQEYEDVENGKFVKKMFPDIFSDYVKGAKDPKNVTDEYYDKIVNGNKNDKYKYAKRVNDYEEIIMSLHPNKLSLRRKLNEKDLCLAKLVAHYFQNRCFTRDIMGKIHNIRHIPTTIVQGRYDAVTPAYYAYKLHKALPKSKIYFTIAGHTMEDDGNSNKLREIFGGIDDKN
tara:strand:- start:1786 stop:2799 length:1014 start_codon:yes stop_codon:yes gene_type:complete